MASANGTGGGKSDRLSQRIAPELKSKLEAEARRLGVSAAAVVQIAITEYFDRLAATAAAANHTPEQGS